MNETSVFTFILLLIGYIASFLFGYYLSQFKRLAADSKLRPDVSGDIEKDAGRIGDLADGLDEVISAGDDITDIFAKYAFESEAKAKLEQDSDRGDSDILND